jgi:hypothetical protein
LLLILGVMKIILGVMKIMMKILADFGCPKFHLLSWMMLSIRRRQSPVVLQSGQPKNHDKQD